MAHKTFSLAKNSNQKYWIIQARLSDPAGMVKFQIFAPNHTRKSRPYGFTVEVSCPALAILLSLIDEELP